MIHAEWQVEENKYLEVLNQLTEQEQWAKSHGHHLLAKAYSEGSKAMLNELGVLQKLRQKDSMSDFTSKVIALKAMGYYVENMCNVYGPQFDGQYRWMMRDGEDFQDGDVSYSEADAWKDCIRANVK